MLFNGQGRPLNIHAPALTLPASMGGNRTPIIDQKQFDKGGVSRVELYHKELVNGRPIVKNVPEYLRRITVEEAAILQSFPQTMKFKGSQTNQFKQIGNAVPPLLAFHVAKSLPYN